MLRCSKSPTQTGIETTLRQVGISEADLDRLADDAMLQTRLLGNNPRELTRADAHAIYAAALPEQGIGHGRKHHFRRLLLAVGVAILVWLRSWRQRRSLADKFAPRPSMEFEAFFKQFYDGKLDRETGSDPPQQACRKSIPSRPTSCCRPTVSTSN